MTSPVAKTKIIANLDFFEAFKHLIYGKKITKAEWGDENYYGFIESEIVKLHKSDGSVHNWIISTNDMAGTDWQVIEN